MKYLHIDWINGLCVQFNQKLVLVLVHSNDEGTLNFSFIDPLTDEPVLTEDEERELLLSLMQEGTVGSNQQEQHLGGKQ